jgi:flagellar protein FlbT
MHISLRAGERLFINGAVLRVDRKVSLELMNDATFLLEAHVMRVEDASTPLRQLYFIVQVMLMDPGDASVAEAMFDKSITAMIESVELPSLIEALKHIRALVGAGRAFDALKAIRGLFAEEARILNREEPPVPTRAA